MSNKIDFAGYATKNNIVCTDGLIIGENAFAHNDGEVVPIFWQHQQNSIDNLLGHGTLENRSDGVYVYGEFNDSEQGKAAKKAVQHGDVTSLSIYANKIKRNGNTVTYGDIKEVSLVVAGANKGAKIEYVGVAHDASTEGECVMRFGLPFDEISHSETSQSNNEDDDMTEEKINEIIDSMTDEQKELLYSIASGESDSDAQIVTHGDESSETIADVLNTLNEKQNAAVAYLIGKLLEENGDEDKMSQSEDMEEQNMKTNAFELQNGSTSTDVLMHAEEVKSQIIADIKRYGSLREAFRAHEDEVAEVANSIRNSSTSLMHSAGVEVGTGIATATYGIADIDWLFPEARTVTNTPEFIKRRDEWVGKVMGGVTKTPFSRVKSVFADITADEARAKGYTKGHLKTEEVFGLLKRVTTPTTVYKKQKLDRDDVVDITDFDVILWLKAEMRVMLDEELARAFLIGDGRTSISNDKINESNIRPIYSDDVLFTIRQQFDISGDQTDEAKAKHFIKECVKARKNYKGSGNPVLFTTEDMLTNMILIEDGVGRIIYDTMDKLKGALRVSDIVTVPQMATLSSTVSGTTYVCDGIIVNLKDYTVGSDKGGAVSMFDDFDIDYNQQKYLIETRCSGALTRPKSAIVVEHYTAAPASEPTEPSGT